MDRPEGEPQLRLVVTDLDHAANAMNTVVAVRQHERLLTELLR